MRPATRDRRPARLLPRSARARGLGCLLLCLGLLVISGCGQNMRTDARLRPLEPSQFYPDQQSARPVISGTVALGMERADELLYTGKLGGQVVNTFPFTVTQALIVRGQGRYNVYCAPCHGLLGDGNGMIVQRGLSPPPTFHQPRLRDAPAGHFFDVITNGYGRMYSYASRVGPEDRWAIIAYIRALQLSQNATLADVPPDERQRLAGGDQ